MNQRKPLLLKLFKKLKVRTGKPRPLCLFLHVFVLIRRPNGRGWFWLKILPVMYRIGGPKLNSYEYIHQGVFCDVKYYATFASLNFFQGRASELFIIIPATATWPPSLVAKLKAATDNQEPQDFFYSCKVINDNGLQFGFKDGGHVIIRLGINIYSSLHG